MVAGHADRFLAGAVARSEERLAREITDPVLLRWSARVAVHATIEAVIAWLQVGDAARDQAFLAALGVTPVTGETPPSWSQRVAEAFERIESSEG